MPEYRIEAGGIEAELARFRGAVQLSLKQLKKLKTKSAAVHGAAAEEMGYLLDAHLAMLFNSRLVRGVERRIEEDRINAERAVQSEIGEIGVGFAAMGDAYLAGRVEDVRVVGSRLLRNLTKTPYAAFQKLAEGTVILAEELTPADTALLDPRRIAGFATVLGGAESHTAIMARALNLPAVLGVAELLAGVDPGEPVLIDGGAGLVILNPAPATVERYTLERDALEREHRRLQRLRRLPAVTRDNVEIVLQANLELPRELDQALAAGAQGLGLVRTEFLYMNREDLPDEDEQYKAYAELVRGMEGKPVTIRTLDIGGDKLAAPLSSVMESEGNNPALGLRAIRLSLKERRLLDAQLAAMLRAAALGPVRILLPMISSVGEVHRVREAMAQTVRRLRRRGVRVPHPLPPLGRDDRDPGRRPCRRCARRRRRFLRDRHQRSDPVHARDRPRRRAGCASLQPAAPGGSASHPVRGRGGAARAQEREPVRRDGGRSALHRAPPRPRHPRPVDGALQHPAGQGADPPARPRLGRAPRARHHGSARRRPHRRPARRLQRPRLTGGCAAPTAFFACAERQRRS